MVCGIDEAGRGCLAGPLVVAGVILQKEIKALDDSKKLTPKKREALFDEITTHSRYEIVFTSNHTIDEIGLSKAIRQSIEQILHRLKPTRTIFDGNTSFGIDGIETLIKADTLIPAVSAASILAKVSRDRYIIEQSKQFPQYGFENHKGYGTKAHIEMIKKHGYCALHRRTFRVKELEPNLFDF